MHHGIAGLIDSGKMPIKYSLSGNNNLSTEVNIGMLKICIYALMAIALLGLVYLFIKYKINGILLSISYIGYIALLLIVLRYTNVIISIASICSFIVLLAINYMFIQYILSGLNKDITKKELIKQAYLRYIYILFPILLIGIIFTFMKWIPISSIGMVLFWGLIVMFIYNYIIVNALLEDK